MSVVERMLRRGADDAVLDAGVLIEPMRRRDLRAGVLETELEAYPTPWSPGVFQSELDQVRSGSRHYVVARCRRPDRRTADDDESAIRRDGHIVGHAGLWFVDREAHVTTVAVRADARRRGLARRLLLVLADRAIERGAEAWTLEVRTSSTGAQALYRGFGFAPAGVRRRYYDNQEDAIVMWCHDIQSSEYAQRLDRIAADHGITR